MGEPTSSSSNPTTSNARATVRDRRNEEPHPNDRPVIEGIINPAPRAFDPRNPANAPRPERLHDDEDQAAAHDELSELLRTDISRMSPAERRAHDARIHELHYHANGLDVPQRGRRPSPIVQPADPGNPGG